MFSQLRRRWQTGRAKPGDGSALPVYRFWQLFARSLFFVELPDETGRRHVYEVDVRHLADSTSKRSPASLYRDGVQVQRGNVPVAFPVPGGVIEVATNQFGLRRMHYVAADGRAQVLRPHPRSQEGLRARFTRRFPRTSAVINVLGLVVLVVGLGVTGMTLAEQLLRPDALGQYVGTFTAPIQLPFWVKTTLAVAGAVAGTDRALRLKSTLGGGG